MKQKNIESVSKNACTGCGACEVVCPTKCISLQSDAEGFLMPVVDQTKCVQCGLCLNACQTTDLADKLPYTTERKYFSGIIKDKEILEQSSSGGVFGMLAQDILQHNGVVCGCVFDAQKKEAYHIVTDEKCDIKRMYGSKYVQSSSSPCFHEIRTSLEQGREVLFTGTACQIAALRLYLKKDYQTLYLVEILCHGVPSPKLFQAFVEYLEKYCGGNILDIRFRDKEKRGWGSEHRMSVLVEKNGKRTKRFLMLPAYFSAFFYGLNLRRSCYECQFAKKERIADITIGDFWGARKKFNRAFPEGISILSVNSAKGEALLERNMNAFSFLERLSEQDAIYSNDNFEHSVRMPKERAGFYAYFIKHGYEGIWKKTYTTKSYRRKTVISFYGALMPKAIQEKLRERKRRY